MPMLSVNILRNVSENSFPLHQCTLLSCTGTYCTDYVHFRFLFGIYLDTVFRPPNLLLAIHIMDDI